MGLAPQTPPPVRDPAPAPARGAGPARGPMERSMPVGSSSITGVVTAADSGRPVAGARVQLNGTAGNPAALESVLSAMRAARGVAPANGSGGASNSPTVQLN